MSDLDTPAKPLSHLSSEALALRRALGAAGTGRDLRTLAGWITDVQDLSRSALDILLDHAPARSHATAEELLSLERLAQIAKAAQDAGAELTAALARAVENQRRCAAASSGQVVVIGPSPQQLIASAVDLLGRIPALCHAIHRDRLVPPTHHAHRPR
ncbi:4-alpha-glucanotransferase [Streptomyces pratensis]|nr:4-alpha-glucanotransferase [Streptomyces pratensis]